MQKIFHVFVSSTYSDLQEERRRVSEALAKAGYVPEGMELFPASSQKQFDFIKRVVDRCDYYVVIIGGRYGSIADGEVSYTEKEYEYALDRGIPTLAFLHRHPEAIPAGKSETEPDHVAKLSAFRQRLSAGALVDFWDTPADLTTSVVVAVGQEINLNPGIGWVRGDQAVDPRIFEELSVAQRRVTELERQIATSAVDDVTFPQSIAHIDSKIHLVCNKEHYVRAKDEDDFKIVEKHNNIEIDTTWRDVFMSLQTELYKNIFESRFSMEIPEKVAALQDQRNGIVRNTDASFDIFYLTQPDVAKFRHQFEALGLIYAEYETRTVTSPSGDETIGRSDYVWRLTEKGRKFIAQSMAEKAIK